MSDLHKSNVWSKLYKTFLLSYNDMKWRGAIGIQSVAGLGLATCRLLKCKQGSLYVHLIKTMVRRFKEIFDYESSSYTNSLLTWLNSGTQFKNSNF